MTRASNPDRSPPDPERVPIGQSLAVEQPAGPDHGTSGATVIRGGMWNVATYLVPNLHGLVVAVAAARFLGPEGMGRASYISFVSASLITALTLGLPVSLMRHIGESIGARNPGPVRGLLRWAWRVSAVSGLAGLVALTTAAAAGAEPRAAWILAGVACAVAVPQATSTAVLTGTQRWREASVVGLVTGTIGAVATVAFLALGAGIVGVFVVFAAVGAANAIWTTLLARRALVTAAPVSEPAGELRRRTIRYARFVLIDSILTIIVFQRSEFFFLARYSSDTEIAFYTIAFMAVNALVQIPVAVVGVVAPAFATLYGALEMERIRSGYARAVRLLLVGTLPLTAVAAALGPTTLQLVFGDQYTESGPPLLVMLAIAPLIPVMSIGHALLVGLSRARFWLYAASASAVLNIALNVVLVPRYDAVGAAFANAGAQAVNALLIISYANRLAGPTRLTYQSVLRLATATIATGLAAWAVVGALGGFAGVLLGAIAGVGAFAVVASFGRLITPEDAAWVERAAGGVLGGSIGWVSRRLAYGRQKARTFG